VSTVDRSTLAAKAEWLAGVRVLCLGDVMLDRYVYGAVERVSPEAPIPVLRIERERSMLGGAGNVVRNLAALGAAARFVSVLGDDATGREVRALLAAENRVESRLLDEAGRDTGVKTRFVAGAQQLLRTDQETIRPISARSEVALIADLAAAIDGAETVILSDYGKGVLTPDVVAETIKLARARKKRVVVDPKGVDFTGYRGAFLVTPNRAELAAATHMPTSSEPEVEAAARRIIAECDIAAVLATRGADGMMLISADGRVDNLPAEAREVFDVSGAGDTVVATCAAALAAGLELIEAAHLANVAAGIVVAKAGTAVAHLDEIFAALHAQELMSHERKVVSLAQAADKAENWRRQGLKVAFTNGCFDLLHPGHISLLAQARASSDRLVVGLNSDASTRRLKGESRPIQRESERAIVLASLSTVDLVVTFDDDTPLKLIESIAPDVLVKGADYTIATVVGAEFVQSYGGRIMLAEITPGQSTTATIERMGR